MEKETKYTVLNPCGYMVSRERIPLAPRIPNLDGKTIYLLENAQYGVLGEYGVLDALKKTFPGANFVQWTKTAFDRWTVALADFPPSEVMTKVDATICGVGW